MVSVGALPPTERLGEDGLSSHVAGKGVQRPRRGAEAQTAEWDPRGLCSGLFPVFRVFRRPAVFGGR